MRRLTRRDQRATRFRHQTRLVVAEILLDGSLDRFSDRLGRRHRLIAIDDRKTAAKIDQIERDIRLSNGLEDGAGMPDRRLPDERVGLLAADME